MYFMVTPTFKHNAVALFMEKLMEIWSSYSCTCVVVYFTHFFVTVKLVNSFWRPTNEPFTYSP